MSRETHMNAFIPITNAFLARSRGYIQMLAQIGSAIITIHHFVFKAVDLVGEVEVPCTKHQN